MPKQKLLTKISTFIPKWFWCPQILNFEDMTRIWCRYRQENQEKTSNWSFLFFIYWISFCLRDVKLLHSTSSSLEESIGVGYLQVESKFQVLLSLQSHLILAVRLVQLSSSPPQSEHHQSNPPLPSSEEWARGHKKYLFNAENGESGCCFLRCVVIVISPSHLIGGEYTLTLSLCLGQARGVNFLWVFLSSDIFEHGTSIEHWVFYHFASCLPIFSARRSSPPPPICFCRLR